MNILILSGSPRKGGNTELLAEAFANYLLSEGLWKGEPIIIEQGGYNRIFNSVKLKCQDAKVLFGGKATKKIEGTYYI